MLKGKSIKNRGKIQFSEYFKEFKNGDFVAIIGESSLRPKYPARMQGRTGRVIGKKGRAYVVQIIDGKQKKSFIMLPAHLKKIEHLNTKK